MPEHIRALLVIIFLSFIVFTFAKKPAQQIIPLKDFIRRRNLWIGLTLVAFLSQNFWFYAFITGTAVLTSKKEDNPVALFFMLLFVIPAATIQVSGLGLVNYLFSLSHQRLLSLTILLPAYLLLRAKKDTLSFGRLLPDKLILTYMLLVVLLYLRETSITDVLRQSFYQFIDIFLPYFVISRSIITLPRFRHALYSFVLATMVVALIAVFESAKNWLLYKGVIFSLGMDGGMTGYLGRSGLLRAISSAGHSIALGYLTAVAIGLYLFLQPSITSKFYRHLGLFLLVAGLIAALSRGPWVGALFIIIAFIASGRHAVKQLSKLVLIGIIAMPVMSFFPFGEKIINLLPFISDKNQENVDYRERLFDASIIVIKRHLLLGSVNFRDTPEMESMRQGQGIIDIVNSYLNIALRYGLIGLTLFSGFFISISWGVYRSFRSLPQKDSNEYLLGRSLLATLLGIMLIIFTVSSITIIPIVYWSMAGLGAGYIIMIRKNIQQLKHVHNE